MAKQVFINLAVKNVQKSMDFYTALGFTNNTQFSDDNGNAWFGVTAFMSCCCRTKSLPGFATKPIADTKSNIAALLPYRLIVWTM